MGSFSDKLAKRLRGQTAPPAPKANVERLVAVAILRDGAVIQRGFKSHWELRAAINPDRTADHTKHIPGDVDGFYTSNCRFVTREEAVSVAVAAGQIGRPQGRPLLSSDIEW